MEERRHALIQIVQEIRPCSVRSVFYQAVSRGIVPKTVEGLGMVERPLKDMRWDGRISFEDIVDGTRHRRGNYDNWAPVSPKDYLVSNIDNIASGYDHPVWHKRDRILQIWLEKDGLAAQVGQVTSEYSVPLYVARGFASMTIAYQAAREVVDAYDTYGQGMTILYLADYDVAGQDASSSTWYNIRRVIREVMRREEVLASFHHEDLLVRKEHIAEYDLPTRPEKQGSGDAVELDAMPPHIMRGLLRQRIEQDLPKPELDKARAKTAAGQKTARSILSKALKPK